MSTKNIELPNKIYIEANQYKPGVMCLIEDTWLMMAKDYFEIKKGFWFDGMSMPRILWFFYGHPFSIETIIQVLWHDIFYSTHYFTQNGCDRYLDLMNIQRNFNWKERKINCHISLIKRKSIYYGLRMGGWVAYNNKKLEEISGSSKHLHVNGRQFDPGIMIDGA